VAVRIEIGSLFLRRHYKYTKYIALLESLMKEPKLFILFYSYSVGIMNRIYTTYLLLIRAIATPATATLALFHRHPLLTPVTRNTIYTLTICLINTTI
jgi:hypothetical protein